MSGNTYILMLILVNSFQDITGQVSLSPKPATVIKGQPLTVVCQSSSLTPASFQFARIEKDSHGKDIQQIYGTAWGNSKQCSDKLICDFDNNTFTLTTQTYIHNQVIICRRVNSSSFVQTDNTTVFIQVPVGAANLTPSTTPVTVVEGNNLTFNCTTGVSRPSAIITWYKGNESINGNPSTTSTPEPEKYITTEIMTYTGDKDDQGKSIRCQASNIKEQKAAVSNYVMLNILYIPDSSPELRPVNSSVNENENVTLLCNLTSLGNPPVTWSWICGNENLTSKSTNSGTHSVLSFIAQPKYNQKMCHCRATTPKSPLMYDEMSKRQRITVFYNNKITSVKFTEGSSTIKEHERVSLQCKVEGYPMSTIQWEKIEDGLLLKRDVGVSNSTYTIPAANCLDTGLYRVTANNKRGKAAENITAVFVKCSPRLDGRFQNQSATEIAISNDDFLHIAVGVISYPTPTEDEVVWTFMSKDTNKYENLSNDVDNYHISVNLSFLEQRMNLKKENLTMSDFGTYILTIRHLEGTFTSEYEVDSARPPSTPSNLSLNCDDPEAAHLSWVSEFNGGDQQNFLTQYKRNSNIHFINGSRVGDEGFKVTHKDTFQGMEEGQYWFRIKASNKYGETSSDTVMCHVIGLENQSSHIGLIAGIVSSVVVIVIISAVAAAFILFRKQSVLDKKSKKNSRSSFDLNGDGRSEGDGLTDNVLYISAGPRDVDERPGVSGTGDVYSQVNKVQNKCDNNSNNAYAMVNKTKSNGHDQMDGPVYSDVVKPKKGGKKDKGKKDRKDRKKEEAWTRK